MKSKARDIATVGILSAILLIGKIIFDYIPNVEVVTLLLILFAITYGIKSIYISTIFCLCNGLMYGFGSWLIVYFIVYNGLVLVSYAFKKPLRRSIAVRVLFTSVFGLTFGLWFAIEWALMYGLGAGIVYYFNGITFDVIHMVGNVVVMMFLSKPLMRILDAKFR